MSQETNVQAQAIAMAEHRGRPEWVPADKWLPPDPRCVLATDLEAHFIACFEDGQWINSWTLDPIDSVITHWMDLPELPEDL